MDEEIRRIIQAERSRNRESAARRTARLSRAQAEARNLAARFAQAEPSLRRVILFGSVATGLVRNDRFDIDLAVEADRYGALLCAAEESEFRVDLVELPLTSERFRRLVEQKGTVLYESKR